MDIKRRAFLTSSVAAIGAATLPGWAHAQMTMGNVRIDTLSDGNLVLPRNVQLGGLPEPQLTEILTKYGVTGDELTPDCNVTLLRDGTNTVLFDVGAGPNFMSSAGRLWEAMDALGVAPNDVTHVLFTHGHPDHLWGLLDDFDDFVFPNASYMMGRAERDYWMDPATPDSIGQDRMAFAAGAVRYIGAMEDQVQVFEDGQELLPGIAARASVGHTPGHMSFEIRSGSDSVMVLGDCIGNQHVAFEKPDWFSGSDQDQDTAAATRIRLLDQLASEQIALIGYHLPHPGIGRAEKTDSGFRFVAAN